MSQLRLLIQKFNNIQKNRVMLKNKLSLIIIAVAAVAAMGSCNIYKNFEMPEEGIAGEYAKVADEPIDSTSLGNIGWQEMFQSPQLQELITIALENNYDLQNAKLNIDIAQAQLLGAKLSYLPSLNFTPVGSISSLTDYKISNGTYQLPLAASWEIDIFSGIRNSKRRAQAMLLQSESYKQAVQSQLISSVANTYYTLVALDKQLAISIVTAKKWEESVSVMKDMKEAGRYTEVAVVQSQANYYAVMSSIPSLEIEIKKVKNTLSLLLGTEVKIWDLNLLTPTLDFPDFMNVGIPMSALAVRPDVKAAEQTLASAYYSTNIARSNFYPKLVISAEGGFANLIGDVITNPGEFFLGLAAQLAVPIFNRGTNIANLRVAKAQQEQSLNSFEYTLLNASADVSNALTMYNMNREKLIFVDSQVESLAKAVDYNQELMLLGTTSYLEVLTAQQALLSAQIERIQTELSISQSAVSMYQTLGGGR